MVCTAGRRWRGGCTARANQHHCLFPLIVPHLDELDGTTYAELFANALDIIRKVYDNKVLGRWVQGSVGG